MSQSYTIPSVVSQTPRGDRIMDVYSHLLTERIIYLGTPIDAGVANTIIAQLLFLESVSRETEIQLTINCEGGDPSAMLAIYDTMQYIRPAVATTCVGQAIGAGAVLLAAGNPGKRLTLPHTRVILHQPSTQGRRGTIPELILHADEAVRVRAELEDVLARHSGQSVETLRRDTDHDRVFTAAEAQAYGLVDHVVARR
ncbi:ATP-dependent Clp protease proteolytic subunit [Leucobacter sp. 7(1)]|uniref:ClpP family protease n=1 Tax=Leucobacter sp. 7(1) TaxID=1255613 RepID=UPI00097EFAB9|nr:ATP-dependent Clp protease proteolytic subunit [Leucobacter sp. 7(1)]SJN12919.1 ATP-dependent Clp protease proteolytic subunit [Leucobacter sp. 7(1)]